MSRALAVLRPEPGNRATCAAVRAAGMTPIAMPLFVLAPIDWTPPDPVAHDALMVTSANALHLAGRGLGVLAALPVLAVGPASAAAARALGLAVALTGEGGAADLARAAAARGYRRVLHLAAREHRVPGPPVSAAAIVYGADPCIPAAPDRLIGSVALVHSPRAGAALAALVDAQALPRAEIGVAAISDAARDAAGAGWRDVVTAAAPHDAALIAAARCLAD